MQDYLFPTIQSNEIISKYLQPLVDFDMSKIISIKREINTNLIKKHDANTKYFQIQNRRYLGNKYKLLSFINSIIVQEGLDGESFCDLFAGTGVVGEFFSNRYNIISNDILNSNYVVLKTFLERKPNFDISKISQKIEHLNSLKTSDENYYSKHYGNKFFTDQNALKIGAIREEIEKIAKDESEKNILLTSLIYACDKIANTVGHYDAYRKDLSQQNKLELLVPYINPNNKSENKVYCEDANVLIKKIKTDILYLDPPYNSRQYSDAYHFLENLSQNNHPEVFGKAGKMDRTKLKSKYCLSTAIESFEDLVKNADCKYILLSYNNTLETKNPRSNAKMQDVDIIRILESKGELKVFETDYKGFTTGKNSSLGNIERIFLCKVK